MIDTAKQQMPLTADDVLRMSIEAPREGNGNGTGQPTTATAIFQDISDQKRLDALHLRAQRLEAVAELSASLAHEIKNPLACIRSAVATYCFGSRRRSRKSASSSRRRSSTDATW